MAKSGGETPKRNNRKIKEMKNEVVVEKPNETPADVPVIVDVSPIVAETPAPPVEPPPAEPQVVPVLPAADMVGPPMVPPQQPQAVVVKKRVVPVESSDVPPFKKHRRIESYTPEMRKTGLHLPIMKKNSGRCKVCYLFAKKANDGKPLSRRASINLKAEQGKKDTDAHTVHYCKSVCEQCDAHLCLYVRHNMKVSCFNYWHTQDRIVDE